MKVSTWILSMAMAVCATICTTSPVSAVQLQNITVNGLPYSEGMTAPAADVLVLAGNIITSDIDDFNKWYLQQPELYAGVGFFAAGSDPCIVPASIGLLSAPANPDAQMYWPDPARCVPNFSISATVDTNLYPSGYPLNLKFDQTSGAFSNIKVPVAAISGNDTFTITYQLNHWSWPSQSAAWDPAVNSKPIWPDNSSLASVRWNTTALQYFRPQVTLTFKKSSDACTRKISATATDNNASLTLLASIIPSCAEAGKSNKIWLVANVPNVGWFFKNSSGTWTSLPDTTTATIEAAAYVTGVQSALSFPIVDHLDVTALTGTDVYVGYGTDANDLVSNSKITKVFTFR